MQKEPHPSKSIAQLSQQLEPNATRQGDTPLSMTIYDLPDPQAIVQWDAKRTTKGRLLMILVLLVCAAPVVMSYLTFYVIRPSSVKSFGELVQPTRSIPFVNARAIKRLNSSNTFGASEFNLSALKGQWLMVSVTNGACNQACEQTLYFVRQIHAALGRESGRVDRVWLVVDNSGTEVVDEKFSEILKSLGQSWVISLPQEVIAKWLAPKQGQGLQDYIYLVDPMGEWMMRFPAALDINSAPKVRKDIERLLRASESWDTAGRDALPLTPSKQPPANPLLQSGVSQ